jgi:hypothetical protein
MLPKRGQRADVFGGKLILFVPRRRFGTHADTKRARARRSRCTRRFHGSFRDRERVGFTKGLFTLPTHSPRAREPSVYVLRSSAQQVLSHRFAERVEPEVE